MLSYDSTSQALNGIRCFENLNFLFQLCVLFVSHRLICAFMFYHFQNVVPEFNGFFHCYISCLSFDSWNLKPYTALIACEQMPPSPQ